MFYTIMSNTIAVLEKELLDNNAIERLKKLFFLECKYNLGLLDAARWEGLDEEFEIEICKYLRVEAAKAINQFPDMGVQSSIYKKVQKFCSESKNDSMIISLITRIDVLTSISDLPESVKHKSKEKHNIRIRNLRNLILEILEL